MQIWWKLKLVRRLLAELQGLLLRELLLLEGLKADL
jgi:hypothetical protein